MVNAYLLISPSSSAFRLAATIESDPWVRWCACTYGPHPVVAYVEAEDHRQMTSRVEELRDGPEILCLDARVCKPIPGDEDLGDFAIHGPEVSVLLISVDYTLERERDVTYNLRKMKPIVLARAMWGPTDIVAIIEADTHEDMRNLICDEVKTMRGVKANTTLYCYPGNV